MTDRSRSRSSAPAPGAPRLPRISPAGPTLPSRSGRATPRRRARSPPGASTKNICRASRCRTRSSSPPSSRPSRTRTLLVVATPVAALPAVAASSRPPAPRAPLVWLSKGFLAVPATAAHPAGVALAHQLLAPLWQRAGGRRLGTELCRGSRARTADGASRSPRRMPRSRRASPRCCARKRCAPTKATTSPASRSAAP